MLLARGCPADQPRARALLAAAALTAAELGMWTLGEKTAALIGAAAS